MTAAQPLRLRELPLQERQRWIQRNPLYGRIICRCEGVSEGEIVDALHGPVSCNYTGRRQTENPCRRRLLPGRVLPAPPVNHRGPGAGDFPLRGDQGRSRFPAGCRTTEQGRRGR